MTRHSVILMLTVSALAQPVLADGARLFALHCAACHGQDATGNGPMTPALKQMPPDLTRLSVQSDGTFPTAAVIAQIDGRSAPEAHGGTMPVYGWLFEGQGTEITLPDGTRFNTTVDIALVVSWLESIQKTD